MRLLRSLCIAPLVFLLACGASVSNVFVPLKPPPHAPAPRSADSVEVFTTPRIEHPYVEVGIVKAYAGAAQDESVLLQELRAEAAKHGCDAVYVHTAGELHFVGTCLVYTNAPTTKP